MRCSSRRTSWCPSATTCRRRTSSDADEQRELEARAAGLKAANTWHASRAIQEAREACGGAGYMAENRLIALRGDTDVFTTFEGDNHVLTQLVAKELLTAYADDIKSMSPVEWVRFAANTVGERVMKRTAAEAIMQRIVDARQDSEEEGSLFNRGTQVNMFEEREDYLLSSVARRLQGKSKEMSEFDAFNAVQDHVLHAATAHIDRVVLEAFVAGIDVCPDRGGPRAAGHRVRPVCAVGDRGRQGLVHRASRICPPSEPRRSPGASMIGAGRCARTPRRWSTVSAFRSNCVTPRCCTRRTWPTDGEQTLSVRTRARVELAICCAQRYWFGIVPSARSLPSGPIWNLTVPPPLGQQGWSLPFCHWYGPSMVSSDGGSTVMYGFGFGVGEPNGVLWSKNNNCWGVDSLAMVGMICTQYNRHFLVCPRAISTHLEPGTAIGTEAMARFTVSAVGPSEDLHLSDAGAAGVDAFPPHPPSISVGTRISRIATNVRRTARA